MQVYSKYTEEGEKCPASGDDEEEAEGKGEKEAEDMELFETVDDDAVPRLPQQQQRRQERQKEADKEMNAQLHSDASKERKNRVVYSSASPAASTTADCN